MRHLLRKFEWFREDAEVQEQVKCGGVTLVRIRGPGGWIPRSPLPEPSEVGFPWLGLLGRFNALERSERQDGSSELDHAAGGLRSPLKNAERQCTKRIARKHRFGKASNSSSRERLAVRGRRENGACSFGELGGAVALACARTITVVVIVSVRRSGIPWCAFRCVAMIFSSRDGPA